MITITNGKEDYNNDEDLAEIIKFEAKIKVLSTFAHSYNKLYYNLYYNLYGGFVNLFDYMFVAVSWLLCFLSLVFPAGVFHE